MLQSSGTVLSIGKKSMDTGQCADDNRSSEENEKPSFKKDQDLIQYFVCSAFYFIPLISSQPEIAAFYPPGFYSKPFMPPRNS